MIRNKKTLRGIAIFFLIDILSSIFLPSLSFADSGSPSMPEYSSFQSASGNEMVDLQTGDFKYNVPLLDVPGPEGNYPVNLFYQAGIKLEQEASWVGLGWNINAGAITRDVDVFADDYSGANYIITETGSTTDKLDEPLGINSVDPSAPTGVRNPNPYKFSSLSATNGTAVYGSIQTYNATNGTSTPTIARTLDSYAMSNPSNGDYFTNHNPEKDLGGSMPAYDHYVVSGQGLGSLQGEIQPVNLENGSLFRQQVMLGATVIKDFTIDKAYTQPKLQFRYVNEFSNSFKATPTDYNVTSTSTTLNFGGNGLGYSYTVPDANGLKTSTMRLAGAKHIEYYTNAEISGTGGTSGTSTALKNGFIKYQGLTDAARNSLSYTDAQNTTTYTYDVSKQVGGFSVTDETGNTYHYALPVYTYEAYKNFDASFKFTGVTARTISTSQAYAYSWLLTAITGPDYSDSNNNGNADEGDLGSWTIFNYGKFTDQYIYRAPYTGYETDLDGAHVYSAGRKEIYYLDAIITRSHTALFQKNNDRLDGKGANDPITGGLGTYSKGVMRLENIFLHRNEDITTFATNNSLTYSNVFDAVQKLKGLGNSSAPTLNNVMDSYDLSIMAGNSLNNYYAAVLKQVNLSIDYSLQVKVPNNSASSGKLTLNSVGYFGPNHSKILPNVDFSYEVSAPKSHQITNVYSLSSTDFTGSLTMGSSNNFVAGDIIKFVYAGTNYYAYLTKGHDANGITNNSFDIIFLGGGIPSSQGPFTAYETKNPPYTPAYPPYTPAFKDYWGYFKGDIIGININGNMNYDQCKQPNSVSAKGTDVWSLRNIKTSLNGNLEISYESDSYKDVVLQKRKVLNISPQIFYSTPGGTLTRASTCSYAFNNVIDPLGIFKFMFVESNLAQTLTENFKIGQIVSISTLGTVTWSPNYGPMQYPYDDLKTEYGSDFFQITDVGADYVSGKFVTPTPALSSYIGYFKNPMIAHCFGDITNSTYRFFHNCSYISFDNNAVKYGGGIRVKKIKVSEGSTSEYYETVYEYNNPASQLSSGTTSYEPLALNGLSNPGIAPNCGSGCYETDSLNPAVAGHVSKYLSSYTKYYNNFLSDVGSILAFSRELPSPGVLYEYVTKKEYANGIQKQGVDQFKFKIFDIYMLQRSISTASATTATGGTNSRATVSISNYTSKVGQLLEKRTYDLGGALLSKSTYEYSSDLQNGQGVLDEVFHEHRKFNVGLASESHKAAVVKRSQYPSILMNVETTDYLKGLTSRTENKSFDLFSGKVLETETLANGKIIISTTVPAYSKYGGMGLKINNSQNRNMLFQEAANYTFRTKDLLCTNVQVGVTTPVAGDQLTISSGTLPLYYSVGSPIEIRGNLSGGLESSLAIIKYISTDRTTFIVNGVSFNIYPNSPVIRVKDSPLSVKINSWNNSWLNRTYSTGVSAYFNTTVGDVASTVNDERVWRPFRSYVWSSPYLNSDGSFKNDGTTGSFSDFDWVAETGGTAQSSPYWVKTNESTLYDQYSNLLEVKDLNGNYVSTKKGYNQSYTLASASNSNGVSFAYSSFEDKYSPASGIYNFGGEILTDFSYQTALTGGTSGIVKPHTGKYMIGLTNATVPLFSAKNNIAYVAEGNIIRGKMYRASIWVHKNSDANAGLSVSITGTSPSYTYSGSAIKQNSTINAGDWYLVNLDFSVPATYNSGTTLDQIKVSCTAPAGSTSYFDDFMVRPVDASVTCNVYDPLTKQLTSVIDNDGFYTRYEYDDTGKLIAAYKETISGEKKTKSYLYNFAKP